MINEINKSSGFHFAATDLECICGAKFESDKKLFIHLDRYCKLPDVGASGQLEMKV